MQSPVSGKEKNFFKEWKLREKKLCAKCWGLRKPQKCWSQIGGDRVVLWRKQSCSWALESFSSQPPFASPASGFAQRLGLCPHNHLPCPTSSSSPSFQLLSSNTQLKPPLLRSIFNHLNQPQNRNRIEWSWIFYIKKKGHGIIQLRKLNPERSEIWMLKVEIIQKQENRKVIHFEKMTILHAFIRGNRITTDTTFRVWKNRLCKE